MCLSLPGKVLEIIEGESLPMAHVDFGGVMKTVCTAYTPEVKVDEYVVVHVGFAITILSEEEAIKTLSLADTPLSTEG